MELWAITQEAKCFYLICDNSVTERGGRKEREWGRKEGGRGREKENLRKIFLKQFYKENFKHFNRKSNIFARFFFVRPTKWEENVCLSCFLYVKMTKHKKDSDLSKVEINFVHFKKNYSYLNFEIHSATNLCSNLKCIMHNIL